jgi:hypothetical protein
MTEQINDQISAFIDDELSADESALLVRRFERDPDARLLPHLARTGDRRPRAQPVVDDDQRQHLCE